MYSMFRQPISAKGEASRRRSYQKTVKEMFFKDDKKKSEKQKLINERK